MKKITKYDVADIVLVCTGLVFLMKCLSALVVLAFMMGMGGAQFWARSGQAAMQITQLVTLCAVTSLLFFARPFLILRFFRGSEDAELEMGEGLLVLTRYGFWIRLFGIVTFLSSLVWFVSQYARTLASPRHDGFTVNMWASIGIDLASLLFGLLIVWKADWISDQLERLGPSGPESPDAVDAIPAD